MLRDEQADLFVRCPHMQKQLFSYDMALSQSLNPWNVKPCCLEKIIENYQIVVCWICTESGKGQNTSKGNKNWNHFLTWT